MNVEALTTSIKSVIKEHKVAIRFVATSESKLLELASVTGTAEHFRANGYKVVTVNPISGEFRVKTSTRGRPWNFSRFTVTKGKVSYEIHMNLMVNGAHDEGTYCVDVGVVQPGAVPSKVDKEWRFADNDKLLTFLEAKKLVIYPMLLAQFIGIVHEIKPDFLIAEGKDLFLELPPTLIVLGHFSGNSAKIVAAYKGRGIKVIIAENYDMRLGEFRHGSRPSPFGDIKAEDDFLPF